MAYIDFAMDCFRPQAEIQSNPEQLETSQSSRFPKRMVQVGVRGESPVPIPPRAAFGSFRRVERNSVTVEHCYASLTYNVANHRSTASYTLSISPTLQAWAKQPRLKAGASPL